MIIYKIYYSLFVIKCTLKFIHKFDKILIEILLYCSSNTYLIVVMSYHFYFTYFKYQMQNVVKILLNL